MLAILAAADGPGPLALRDRALLELLYATGAAITEATNLDLADVAPGEASVVLVARGRSRVIDLDERSRLALARYLQRGRPILVTEASDAVFVNARGGRLSRQAAWLILRAAADRAGVVDDVSPHMLRHSFARHRLAAGADIQSVQRMLGHATPSTTAAYLRGRSPGKDVAVPARSADDHERVN